VGGAAILLVGPPRPALSPGRRGERVKLRLPLEPSLSLSWGEGEALQANLAGHRRKNYPPTFPGQPRSHTGRPTSKRAKFRATIAPAGSVFIAFRRDGVMGLFLVLFWSLAVAGGILRFKSRFGVFNSRLGRHPFPFSPATGIGRQGLDLARCFRHQNGRYRVKSAKFPVPREKPGISSPPAEGAMGTSASSRLSPARGRTGRRVHRQRRERDTDDAAVRVDQ
jgi:hypothetical protein